ncbi:hypothetical protein BASA62_002832 [Batrachochytrium salamandrivorans]|nr:hypothetical protein BASA62_002832 [Batrachochytrium salamandrivorans]
MSAEFKWRCRELLSSFERSWRYRDGLTILFISTEPTLDETHVILDDDYQVTREFHRLACKTCSSDPGDDRATLRVGRDIELAQFL